jgi:hypothetical protein
MSEQTTPPQTTPQTASPDAWGQAATELSQQAPQPAQPSQPQQTNDAWGQAQAELSGQQTQTKPVLSPDEQASQTRQSMVSGLTGMPTPNMSAEDRAQFERGKAAGAVSVPVVAGAATGGTAIAEALPSVLIHTVEGVKALGVWAEAHPYKAFMLYQVAKELLPGAKKAMGLVKAAPTGE